jgi:regulator of protease activity HflC (stomatin/prohibitin superfamily)
VDAVVYFRVVDPIKATVNVQNYLFAVSQQAQTSLRSIIGQSKMDQLLSERDSVNRELRRIIDQPTDRGPVGHPGRAGGDQGRLAAREHEAVHVPPSRGRA